MSDFCYGCGCYVGQGCKCDEDFNKAVKERFEKIAKLLGCEVSVIELQIVSDQNHFDTQNKRELADNNGLRASIMILDNALKEIEEYFIGTTSEFAVQDILKKKSEAILKK